ncbi:MAG: hypothetical protein KIS92_25340 [Planctomycetota bacterium]|nr:hypothetical protein [Planctomycetota bacterium]
MPTLARAMLLALCACTLGSGARAAAAAASPKTYLLPKGWPAPQEKPADAFKRLGSSGKLGVAFIYSASVDPADKDAVKKNEDMQTFAKKIVADKDTLDLLTNKFAALALKAGDKNLAGRGSAVKASGIVIFGTDGQAVAQIENPLESAAAFRTLLLQSEAVAAKAREAKAAERAKEEEQRKKDAEAERKKEEAAKAGKIPGLTGESKTKPPAKKTEEPKAGALQDE